MLRELTANEDARRSHLDRAFVEIKELVLRSCPDTRERADVLIHLDLAQSSSISAITATIPSCQLFSDMEFYEELRRR